MLNNPVIAVVEAKIFNEAEGENKNIDGSIYGVVTTGTALKFMKMEKWNVLINLDEYEIEQPDKIFGILLAMAS